MIQMKKGEMVHSEGIELPSGEKINKSLDENKRCKYLGVLESDKMKSEEKGKSILKVKYFHRIRKILKSNLNVSNTIQAIDTKAVSIKRYGAGIIEWT